MSSGFLGSNAFTETLLAAMASKQFDITSLIKNEFDDADMSIPITANDSNRAQHGIWNTLNAEGLQLLIAQREKHAKQLQKQKRENSDNPGFVYVDVSESSSPASTQSSASSLSLSQPPPSNLSSISSSSSSSQETSTEKALKEALSVSMSKAPRAYRWASPMEKDSFKYKAKRERNNEAVRRSREKNKVKKLLEDEKYEQLRQRYNAMLDSMKKCTCGCAAQFLIDHAAQV
jgi:protease II